MKMEVFKIDEYIGSFRLGSSRITVCRLVVG